LPTGGKVGLFRSIAFVSFAIQLMALPIFLFALIYKYFGHGELLDSNHLIWGLVTASSALVLVLASAKAWNLSKNRPSGR
jgi:hypothetical protein